MKWILLTLAFVNFSGKLVLSGWSKMMHIADMKNLEESKFDCRNMREKSTSRYSYRLLGTQWSSVGAI